MDKNFKFHAMVNGVLYECASVRIDKPNHMASVTVKDFQPFSRYFYGAGCGNVNDGRVPISALRLVNQVTGQVFPVSEPVAHYSVMALDSFHTDSLQSIDADVLNRV